LISHCFDDFNFYMLSLYVEKRENEFVIFIIAQNKIMQIATNFSILSTCFFESLLCGAIPSPPLSHGCPKPLPRRKLRHKKKVGE